MFNTTYNVTYVPPDNVTYVPPDRLLTEMYKDNRDADYRLYERLNKLLNYPTLDRIKMRLYKMKGDDIITDCGERVHKNEIKWFIDYKEKWGY